MESQNKLFEAFKDAAAADEQTTFLAQDKLWGRIEQQLDKQATKKKQLFSFAPVKYIAAALVLITGIAVSWNYFLTGQQTEHNVADRAPTPISTSAPAPGMEQLPVQNRQAEAEQTVKQMARAGKPVPVAGNVAKGTDLVEAGTAATINETTQPGFTQAPFNKTPEALGDQLVLNETAAPSVKTEATALAATGLHSDFPEERLFKVQGVIVDKAGVSLANAKVSVAGTNMMATSDAEGKFTLDVPDTATFLMVQSYGNETKYVKVGERLNYKIEISPDQSNVALLNDIARYNRSSGMQNLYSSPLNTASMRYELASKQKQQTMLRPAPSTDPLIIINGVPYAGKFSDINSKHIKEVKILPEATGRVLYGDRAKNGVIVITLKKGKPLPGR